jgi:peptidoglycan hydrolase-like protein with peptidoglycan-binding domain
MHFMKMLTFSALTLSMMLSIPISASALTHARRGPTSPKSSRRPRTTKPAGQRSIDDTRATQIQSSLIKSGYLSGEASGHWDSQTQAAMQKFQEDNGWQTKIIPDSRAIIKLGLGPSHDSEPNSISPKISE